MTAGRRWRQRTAAALAVALTACSSGPRAGDGERGRGPIPELIKVSSPAFAPNGSIPETHTCEGENVSPPLVWSGVPDGTAELALVVEDPDAPGGPFVHWVVLGLRRELDGLEAGRLPPGSREGRASSERAAYIGPCPPDGEEHRYVFTLYALGTEVDLPADVGPAEALEGVRRAAVAKGDLVGRFAR